MKTKRTPEELKALVKKIQDDIDSSPDKTVHEVIKGHGMTLSQFYNARKFYFGSKKEQPKVKKKYKVKEGSYQKIALPMKRSDDFELRGSPESIARFIREMSKSGAAND